MASSQGLIDQLRAVQLAALDAAPQEVKNSTWYQQFREGVNNFNQTGESAERAWVDLVAAARRMAGAGCRICLLRRVVWRMNPAVASGETCLRARTRTQLTCMYPAALLMRAVLQSTLPPRRRRQTTASQGASR